MGKRDKLAGLTKSWAGRTFQTTRMAAGVGKAAAGKLVRTALDREAQGEGMDELSAEELAARMGQLKGLMMKFGQMASYLDGALPEQAQAAMAKLQADSQPLEWAVICAAIEAELGPLDALFDHIDEEPTAAASIGQVHRASRDGQPVAVKVQYPGVADTLSIDLGNLRRYAFLGTLGTAMSSNEMIGELAERMAEECDYRIEARRTERFRALWADTPGVRIPRVHAAASSERVLTTEWIEGQSFAEFAASATQEERDRAGQRIYDFAFRGIFEHGLLYADPHPGNYLFPGGDEVAFLDFGCVRVFDETFVENWKEIARAVMAGDQPRFERAFRAGGFATSDRFDMDYQWKVMEYLYVPMKTPGFRYSHEYVRQSYDLILWKNPNRFRTPMPGPWLLANRLQWGMNSVLAALGAGGDWGDILMAGIDTPLRIAQDA
ncbi:MAG: AarF/ABC1/UbiB kinase family protein [Deltaproteobacteria bacterium]|nr:MAG: AarF/ABC1/UbiB kinase family protein [Deltaproteobacteria bacterium]